MRVFVAGASGAIGRRLVPRLVARGHAVVATTRTSAKAADLRAMGAEPVVVDGLDGAAVGEAVARAEPDAIVHQMTALAGTPDLRHFDRWFARTNELRTTGTEHLLAAAQAAGVPRMVVQSFTGWNNARTGGPVTTEDDALDPEPLKWQRESMAAFHYLEEAVPSAPLDGIVLRYGSLYGPGASDDLVELVRARRFPLVGGGRGVWSFLHVDDAAAATVLAVERGGNGVFNVVDDDPAPVSAWLPSLAEARPRTLDDRGPRRVQRPLQGPVRLAPGVAELARGLPLRAERPGRDARRGGARRVSAETFAGLRPLLFSIAYRMLGSVGEAEDVVQEAFLRYQRAGSVDSPRAYLSAVVTRLAIDELRSARARRETYVGEWLPEPLLTDERAGDPAAAAERADELSMAFLLVLERLGPVERAVFLLHDVFGYGFTEIAEIVGRSPEACRQLAVRARRRVTEDRPRFEPSREQREALAERFFAAVGDGDVDGLVDLLAADVLVQGDGGGNAPQWARPIVGARPVARLLAGVGRQIAEHDVVVERREVNGQPGAVFRTPDGRITNVFSLEIADGRVQAVRSVINPEKLHHLGPVADVWALVRAAAARGRGGS
jgi:RNA polymerase sigma-70 factor, ECF subfamily